MEYVRKGLQKLGMYLYCRTEYSTLYGPAAEFIGFAKGIKVDTAIPNAPA